MRRALAAVATALLLFAPGPPALFPGAEWLVLPGWMAFYALSSRGRPWAAYGAGVLHVLLFSASLRHVVWAGWLLIGTVGGLYSLGIALALRGLRRLGPPAFGLALAGAHWLRASMPEIPYPHVQPCHALAGHPWILGPVCWGGEAFANFLIGVLAATLVDLFRGWRLAEVSLRVRLSFLAGALAVWALASPRAAPTEGELDVLAVEPGLHPTDPYEGAGEAEVRRRMLALFRERLLEPTLRAAGPGAAHPPALVLWPESSMPGAAVEERDGKRSFAALEGLQLAPSVRLCLGADAAREGTGRFSPAAVLLDARGAYLAHQEKRVLVPVGERLPFLDLLPPAVSARLRAWVEGAMGSLPDAVEGRSLPLLEAAPGVFFGALLCFDNAFPEVAAAEVLEGARLLVVLSNEAWYRGGSERDQLAAMTVIRALETGTPVVRCTTDGLSMAVAGDGRVLAALPDRPAPAPAARTLRISVPLGSGNRARDLPLAWLHPGARRIAGLAFLLGILHELLAWARLHAVRAKSTPTARGRSPKTAGGGGS
ncbi:MAG: hypothetical protein Fur0037_12230 [Planctomycetota bacterium]